MVTTRNRLSIEDRDEKADRLPAMEHWTFLASHFERKVWQSLQVIMTASPHSAIIYYGFNGFHNIWNYKKWWKSSLAAWSGQFVYIEIYMIMETTGNTTSTTSLNISPDWTRLPCCWHQHRPADWLIYKFKSSFNFYL